jgi:hypothetical protein
MDYLAKALPLLAGILLAAIDFSNTRHNEAYPLYALPDN